MKRPDGITKAPGGRFAPLVRVDRAEEVGLAIRPGVIVEVDAATAEDCGACREDCLDAEEAFEASEDPADFDAGGFGNGG